MKLPLSLTVAGPAARVQLPALAAAAGLVVLRVGVVLLRPWPLALAVDHALSGTPENPLTVLVLAALATVVLSAAIDLLDKASLRIVERAAERIGAGLRATMFQQTMTRSLRWHDRMRSGELVSRLTTDVGRVLDGVVAVSTSFLPDAVMLVAVLGLLFAFDPGLALIGLAVVPVLAVLAVRQRRLVRPARQ